MKTTAHRRRSWRSSTIIFLPSLLLFISSDFFDYLAAHWGTNEGKRINGRLMVAALRPASSRGNTAGGSLESSLGGSLGGAFGGSDPRSMRGQTWWNSNSESQSNGQEAALAPSAVAPGYRGLVTPNQGLGVGAAPRAAASVGGGPEPDALAGRRSGAIKKIGLPNPMGSNPYGIYLTLNKPYRGLSGSQGSIWTDDSKNGYRIRKQLLDVHNYVRKLEAPSASFMTKLKWDFHLEAFTRQWGQRLCTTGGGRFFDHSPNNSNGLPAWPYRITTGENLYTSTLARPATDDFSDVVSKWYAERSDFDWARKGPKPGAKGPVGHWKQLVRPQATTVGCSVFSNCKTEGDWRTFVICHYDYGNIGALPYTPKKDSTCQSCPSGYDCCEQGLCSGHLPLSSTTLGPFGPAKKSTNSWYGCSTQRQSCANTGAASFTKSLPNDGNNLEYEQCYCGINPQPANFVDTVDHAYFWFRNKCFQGVQGGGDDLARDDNLYAMLQKNPAGLPSHQTSVKGMRGPVEAQDSLDAGSFAPEEIYKDLDINSHPHVKRIVDAVGDALRPNGTEGSDGSDGSDAGRRRRDERPPMEKGLVPPPENTAWRFEPTFLEELRYNLPMDEADIPGSEDERSTEEERGSNSILQAISKRLSFGGDDSDETSQTSGTTRGSAIQAPGDEGAQNHGAQPRRTQSLPPSLTGRRAQKDDKPTFNSPPYASAVLNKQ